MRTGHSEKQMFLFSQEKANKRSYGLRQEDTWLVGYENTLYTKLFDKCTSNVPKMLHMYRDQLWSDTGKVSIYYRSVIRYYPLCRQFHGRLDTYLIERTDFERRVLFG